MYCYRLCPCLCSRPLPTHTSTSDAHSSVSVSVGSWVLVHTRLVWALWASLTGMGFDSNHPSYHFAGASPLPLDLGYLLTTTPVPTVLLGFLWPWMWGFSTRLVQQAQPLLLTLDVEYYSRLLQLSAGATLDLGHGVSPLSRSQLQCVHPRSYFTHPSKEYFV